MTDLKIEQRQRARHVADELNEALCKRDIGRAEAVLFVNRIVIHEALEAFASPPPQEGIEDRVREGWQGCDNIPRDGTWFMACTVIDNRPTQVRVVHFADKFDRLPISHDGEMWDTLPTHWKPLPAALRGAAGGEVEAQAVTYRDMREIAVELGYPSILEALEDLSELKDAAISAYRQEGK